MYICCLKSEKMDKAIFDLIQEEKERQLEGIELIALYLIL